jgi:hypothetical protein
MRFELLSWLFALAVTVHNLEEAVLLPAWSQAAGRWQRPVGAPVGAEEFRFAVTVLTVLAYAAAYLATVGGRESAGAYLVAGYALAMMINAFLPHTLATLITRRYAPGTATALLLNLPVTGLLLWRTFEEGYVWPSRFVWAGPLVALLILAAIPVLFAVGRWLLERREENGH